MSDRVVVMIVRDTPFDGMVAYYRRDCGELPSREALLWCAGVVQECADEDEHTARVLRASSRADEPEIRASVEAYTKDAADNGAVAALLRRLAQEGGPK